MRKFAIVALVSCTLALAGAQQKSDGRRDWSARLVRLDPAWPKAYFELAEEIADAATIAHEREIASTLFGLAGALDRDGLARSSALALAGLSDEPRRRRSLTALATLLSGASGSSDDGATIHADDRRPSVAAVVALSEAFSFYRRGQGPRAIGMLKAPEVEVLLTRYGAGTPGGADRFREDCRAYKQGLRPEPPREVRIAMLAIEEALLAAAALDLRPREWSSVLIETGASPLIEIDVARLDEAFGVDPTKPYWRDGKWTSER